MKTEKKIWFEDIINPTTVESKNLQVVQEILHESLKAKKFNPKNREIEDTAPRIVFLSVAPKNIIATIFHSSGTGILQALEGVIEQFCLNFKDYKSEDLVVKLDIVTNAIDLNTCKETTIFKKLKSGLQGLSFDSKYELAILPEQITNNSLLNDERSLDIPRVYNYLENNPLDASKFAEILDSRAFQGYYFETEGFLLENKTLEPLYRGQKLYEDISTEDLESSIKLAAHYLNNVVYDSGRFDYSYWADKNRSDDDYSTLRHAGTLFSMVEYYSEFKDPKILPNIKKALSYMERFFVPGIEDPETSAMLERGAVKLGGNGLSLLAISQYIAATGDDTRLPLLKKLANWILTQLKENGSFHGHVQYYPKGNYKNMVSDYYPGECIYGLLAANKISKDPRWVEAAYSIAKWLINIRDVSKGIDELQHDHWLLYGLNELYRVKPDQQFIEHSMKICQSIINAQNLKPKYPDYYGCFSDTKPRSTPAATRSEGMLAAYKLVRDYGKKPKFAESILECVKRTVCFQLRTQYTDLTTMYLPVRNKALGGFRSGLNAHDIRIDFVQHSLSSLISLYQIMKEK